MPRLSQLRVSPTSLNLRPVAPQNPTPVIPPHTPEGLTRSPIMIASLPGLGSGPDTVVRQFNGGRTAPRGRLLVP